MNSPRNRGASFRRLRRRAAAAFLLTLSLLLVASSPCQERPDKALENIRRQVKDAITLYGDTQFEKAVILLRETLPALIQSSDADGADSLAEGFFYLACSLIALDRLKEAEVEFLNLYRHDEAYAKGLPIEDLGPKIARGLAAARERYEKEVSEAVSQIDLSAFPFAEVAVDDLAPVEVPPQSRIRVDGRPHRILLASKTRYADPIQLVLVGVSGQGNTERIHLRLEASGFTDYSGLPVSAAEAAQEDIDYYVLTPGCPLEYQWDDGTRKSPTDPGMVKIESARKDAHDIRLWIRLETIPAVTDLRIHNMRRREIYQLRLTRVRLGGL